MYIKNQLSAELKSLKAISQKARKALKGAPEEALVCSRSNGNIQFYSRKKSDVKATHGTYIKKKDRALAAKLAQAEYERTVLQIADDQIKVLNKFLSNYIANPIQKAYEMMPEDKRNLVKPHILTDEQFANEMNIDLFGNMIRSGIDEGDEAFINDAVLFFPEIFKMRVISHEIFGGRKDVAKPV